MRNKKYLLNKLFFILLGLGVLLVFTRLSNPDDIALPLLIVPFILIGFVLYQITAAIIMMRRSLSNTYLARIIPLSVAFLGVCLLLLGSLHQLTWNDSFLVFGFTALLWLYVWRADFLNLKK